MKYVVLQHPAKGLAVVAGLALSHKELATPFTEAGYRATSAGFIRFLDRERFETFGYSDSLRLTPNADDARLLSAFYSACLRTAPVSVSAEATPVGPLSASSVPLYPTSL